MIAMTATVRAESVVHALPELLRSIRQNYEHLLVQPDQMLVVIPQAGTILVTEKSGRTTFDLVAPSAAGLVARQSHLEAELRRRAPGVRLRFDWRRSDTVPVPFR